ncbi:MAG: HPr-rel-A system PqqD family protein [Candidatus Wallbacteria bacterium HGW-Wallbacteria-1]|jgi:hypothetical protein|uniref:HPr-rel-A system PqqD family protein n=1 Tax=Candidatus Wallbacteria bacterium HGW-Wallbacteria-1 TaxID=2013854 RepID=A0A2N1PL67_9BACT|nr:MAG: HPr-rel-A system PqqD family protein [Candidatus Wallbacteria bacterium HGW-Wallbacteria-1]
MSRLLSLVVNETGFAFDPMGGESFTINHVGRETIELIRQGRELEEIVEEISGRYEAPFEEVYTDILEFLEKLRVYSLL